MTRIGYLAVVVVVIGSVLFGLDWMPAPMSPMPDVKFVLPVAPAPPTTNVTLSPANPPSPAAPAFPAGQAATVEPVVPPAVEVPPGCNVAACAAAYRSFQAVDCSYLPSGGPRRRCVKK